MGTTDLGKTFGIVDMYKDSADPTDVYRVEKAFSKLENADALTEVEMASRFVSIDLPSVCHSFLTNDTDRRIVRSNSITSFICLSL